MTLLMLWLAVMFPLVVSPGPANIVFATSGAQVGIKRSIPLLLGIDLMFLIKSLLIGYGFGSVIQQYPQALNTMQFIGAAYIVYLAFGFLKQSILNTHGEQPYMGFRSGLVIQFFNAKGWVMIVLMFSLFTETAIENVGADFAVISLVVMLAVLNIATHFIWIAFGRAISRAVSQGDNQRALGMVYCLCLMSVAGWLIVDNGYWAV